VKILSIVECEIVLEIESIAKNVLKRGRFCNQTRVKRVNIVKNAVYLNKTKINT